MYFLRNLISEIQILENLFHILTHFLRIAKYRYEKIKVIFVNKNTLLDVIMVVVVFQFPFQREGCSRFNKIYEFNYNLMNYVRQIYLLKNVILSIF